MTEIIEHETKTQELYWHKMTQFKFDLNYYACHFSFCVKTMRTIRISIAVITALSTAIWMEWNAVEHLSGICAGIIIVLQVLSTCTELLPYDKRKQEIRDLQNLLSPVYDAMEKDWSKISDGQYTKEEIRNKVYDYSAKNREIHQHFFKDDSLPLSKKLERKAEKLTTEYYKTMFQ